MNTLLNQLENSSDGIESIIDIITKLIGLIGVASFDDELKLALIPTYEQAIQALNDVLNSNQELSRIILRLIEEYECYSASPCGVFSHNMQVSHRPVEEITHEEDEAAFRRMALADALRKGRTVIVSESDVQVNVPDSECGICDNDFEGVFIPSGKLAGGIPSDCRVCGNPVFSGANYCPYCGTSVSVDKPAVKLHKVQFSAIAPKVLTKGEYTIIRVVMYEESCRHIVDELISAINEPTQETRSGVQKVNEGAVIKIVLNSPDLEIEDNIETGIWQGDYIDFSFALQLPPDFKKRQILLTASVYINDVIASKLKFIVKCSGLFEQKIQISRTDVFSAFISYASQDRNRVAAIIQGMKKARPDLDVFFDVDSLRSGDDWELALREEIERRDVLFLCWSHFARESKWVNEEWRYAFEKKGIDGIEPVPIESPDVCPPPEELRKKHFNDKLLYIINA